MRAAPPTDELLVSAGRADRVRHTRLIPARGATTADWPAWADPGVVDAFRATGIVAPWVHQARTADLAWAGRHVVLATGTASGKSLAYQLPVLTALRDRSVRSPRGATALYLAPTKALAADQLHAISALRLDRVPAAAYDGDTPPAERRFAREHAQLVLTNPDMLHHALLPGHERWSRFLRNLRFVVIDECHHYRGVFGSHVAAVLHRLRRLARHHGGDPVFVLASATAAEPAATARRLLGVDVEVVAEDTSPRGELTFLLWEPPLLPGGGEHGAPTRRPALTETAELLADLVSAGTTTLAFVASRRGAELVASSTRRRLDADHPELSGRVASYRAGYLPEDRRALEAQLRDGRLLGLATTSALELGVDLTGVDAVLICGWPGRRASLWQQAGRAGRAGGDALAVLVARDDPLDTYLVHHPGAIFDQPVEATVLDPDNPYVLAPHLCAAAAELPIRRDETALFGPNAEELLGTLVRRGLLRDRPGGWYWTHPTRAGDLADLRGTGGEPVRIVEEATGRVLGTVDAGASHHAVHRAAVHLHQGRPYLVRDLDLDERVALVEPTTGEIATQARELVDVRILAERQHEDWGHVRVCLGSVEVTSQVVSFLQREVRTGRVLGEEPLDLPARTLRTTAVWWTMPAEVLLGAGVPEPAIPGAAHAAEHAAIGLLPLVATCDRWDVGGVSTALHPDTGLPTIFVHDGHPGGAGFAERGYLAARTWLTATRDTIRDCECETGCPSCVQSPKCGNGNEPLDKAGAVSLLDAVLDARG